MTNIFRARDWRSDADAIAFERQYHEPLMKRLQGKVGEAYRNRQSPISKADALQS